ncbi:MAG: hypothetical protein IKA47_10025 [Oscillospiraceae bacterium]|nr:hypothetical protein [Oscillospiraceae bacterium]
MGYFSNLAAQYVPDDHDHSYTPPEKQLLWRLEELEDRYHELLTQKTGNRDEGVCFSEDNLRYVLPEHFLSASDVRKAMDLAISDLKERYGIQVREETAQVDPVVDEITGMQISFLDILSAPAYRKQLQAA